MLQLGYQLRAFPLLSQLQQNCRLRNPLIPRVSFQVSHRPALRQERRHFNLLRHPLELQLVNQQSSPVYAPPRNQRENRVDSHPPTRPTSPLCSLQVSLLVGQQISRQVNQVLSPPRILPANPLHNPPDILLPTHQAILPHNLLLSRVDTPVDSHLLNLPLIHLRNPLLSPLKSLQLSRVGNRAASHLYNLPPFLPHHQQRRPKQIT